MAKIGRETPSWSIAKQAGSGAIWLRFVGPTLTAEVPDCLRALMDVMPAEDAHLVFDLRRLEGHNPDTKEPFKAWLREHKPRFASVTVIVPKSGTILKVVTAVISLATGVKIRIRDDMDESVSVVNL